MGAVLNITEGMSIRDAITQAAETLFGRKEEVPEEMLSEIKSSLEELDAVKDIPFSCR